MSTTQAVTVTGTPPAIDADEVAIEIDGTDWKGWTSVRITRGLTFCPNHFEVECTELYPGEATQLIAKAGSECRVWIGKDLVITGYIDRVMPAFAERQHSVALVGRGKCQDLVDCAGEWPGQVIRAASVLDVAQKLAQPFGIEAVGVEGPAVGAANSKLFQQVVLMMGETAWQVIERLCRIAGLLAYEDPKGRLVLTNDPGDASARAVQEMGGVTTAASSGFAEGVNVQRAQAVYAQDQRYSHYRALRFSLAPLQDMLSDEANLIATVTDNGVGRYRPHVVIAEMGHALGEANARDRAAWEATRRWGEAHRVQLTTDSWRDSAGKLYAPNTLAALDLPNLKVSGAYWLIGEVTYRKGAQGGTECDLMLMPQQAFSVQPTLPPQYLSPDRAAVSVGGGQ